MVFYSQDNWHYEKIYIRNFLIFYFWMGKHGEEIWGIRVWPSEKFPIFPIGSPPQLCHGKGGLTCPQLFKSNETITVNGQKLQQEKIGKLNHLDLLNGIHVAWAPEIIMGNASWNLYSWMTCLLPIHVSNTPLDTEQLILRESCIKVVKKVYCQIDYLLCKRRIHGLLENARSYGGTKLCSDYKQVVVSINTQNRFLLFQRNYSEKKLDCNYRLASCIETQTSFQREVAIALSSDNTINEDPNSVLSNLLFLLFTSVLRKLLVFANQNKTIRNPTQLI